MAITNQKILEAMKQGFASVDRYFESVDRRFERIEGVLKSLVTREEFNIFKMENLDTHANLATSIERLDQEFTAFTATHDRLEDRVSAHQAVLVESGLMQVSS